jgi:hypothetical protein
LKQPHHLRGAQQGEVFNQCARIPARGFPPTDTLTITSLLPGVVDHYPVPAS